jgi:hypothetical protein
MQDPKSMIAFGMICLAVGIVLPWLIHPSTRLEQDWLHGASGFLYGLSISVIIMALIRQRRCGGN